MYISERGTFIFRKYILKQNWNIYKKNPKPRSFVIFLILILEVTVIMKMTNNMLYSIREILIYREILKYREMTLTYLCLWKLPSKLSFFC